MSWRDAPIAFERIHRKPPNSSTSSSKREKIDSPNRYAVALGDRGSKSEDTIGILYPSGMDSPSKEDPSPF
jgi:hypothetical protein